jgi:hypothetical protein
MSITHTVTRSYKDQSSSSLTLTETVTDNTENNLDDSIAVAVNVAKVWNCTRANLKSLCFYSDLGVTIKTNSSGSPTDTIVLAPGQSLVWTLQTDTLAKCPLSADVTGGIFVTNAASGPARLAIRSVAHQ